MAGKCLIRSASSLFIHNRALNSMKMIHTSPLVIFKKNISSAAASLDTTTNRLVIQWKDTADTDQFPFVWLRDNCQCPACYDAFSKSRTISFADFQLDSKPKSAVSLINALHITPLLILN